MKLINYRYSLDLKTSNSEYIESITLNDVLVEKKEFTGNYMEDWNTEQNGSDTSCPNVIVTA